MEKNKSKYKYTDFYKVHEKLRVSELLNNIEKYILYHYFVEKEGAEPALVRDNVSYLQYINKNKKVTIVSIDKPSFGEFD